MRALKAKDIGPFTKILAKLGIKDILKEFIEFYTSKKTETQNEKKSEEKISTTQLTAKLIMLTIENYHNAEKDLFDLLADLNGKSSDDIADMPISELFVLIKELFIAFQDQAAVRNLMLKSYNDVSFVYELDAEDFIEQIVFLTGIKNNEPEGVYIDQIGF